MAEGSVSLKKILEDLRSSNLKIGEKYKKLNEFVKEARSLNFEEIKQLVNPVDFFSRRLCIDIACALKNLDYLVHLLKTAESSVLRNALRKNTWIYKKDSGLTVPDFLLNELFPVISYTCRQIILTKLPQYLNDEERCAAIFEAVAAKYGFENTGDLIVGCSPAYILKVTTDGKLKLTNRQLKALLRKHPNLVQDYLIEFYKSKQGRNNYSYLSTVQYIARSHPAILISLLESSDEATTGLHCFRPEISNRILRFGKSKILANPKKYVRFLDKEGAYKQLTKDEYVSLFASEWPETIPEFQKQNEYHIEHFLFAGWLKHIPSSKEKGEILQKTFLKKYGVSILENEKCCSIEAIQKILPAEHRTRIAEAKILKAQGQDAPITGRELASMITFKSTDKSIPEIKELIFHEADTSARFQLVTCLVDTCVINQDKAALAEVCKYYVTRHRNEREHLHANFLTRVLDEFDLSEFNSETWSAVFGVVQLILLTQTDANYYQGEFCNIIEHLYIFQILHPAEAATIKCNEMFLRLLKRKVSGSLSYTNTSWEIENIWKKGLNLKDFFGIVMKEFESAYPKNKTKPGSTAYGQIENRIVPLISTFETWNTKTLKSHQQRISIKDFPWLEARVDAILENHEDFSALDRLIGLLMSDPVLKRDEAALRKYLEISASMPLFFYFLRKNPKVLAENQETVETSLLSSTSKSDSLKYVELLKYHGYAELSKKLIQKCKSELQEVDEDKDFRPQAISMLSILTDSTDFLDTVECYLPQTATVDPANEEDAKDVFVRSRLVSSFKNLEFPIDGFPTLLKFCAGDYLKYSIGALYSLSYKSGQDKVSEALTELTQRAVSVKKHGIRLICLISARQVICDFLKTLSETEKNASIRHVILKNLFKTATASSWPVIKSMILTLGEKETNSIGELTDYENIKKIPTEVLEEYFTSILDVINSFENQGQELHKPKLISAIEEFMKSLSTEYTKAFIQKHLFSPQLSVSVQNQVTSLFVEYLLHTVSTNLAENLEILETGLAKLNNPGWDITKIENGIGAISKNRKLIHYLVDALTRALQIDHKKEVITYPNELFQALLNLKTFEQHAPQTFEERLALQFLFVLHVADRTQDFVTGGKELVGILDTYIQKFGREILPLFNKILKSSLNSVNRKDTDVGLVDLLTGILDAKTSNTKEQTLLALKQLPKNPDIAAFPDVQVRFKRVVDIIFNSSDPIVQLYVYYWVTQFPEYGSWDHEYRNELFYDVRQ